MNRQVRDRGTGMRLTERTRKLTAGVDVEAKLSGAAPRGGAQVRRPGAYQRAYKELYTLQIVVHCTSKDRTASAITG